MEAVEEFLSKGIETYLDAQSAVRVFESEVQQRIKAQIVKHDLALKDWWGEHLSLKDYLYSPTQNSVALGQQVSIKDYGGICFYLHFSRNNNGVSYVAPTVSFWRSRLTDLNPLWDSVKSCIPQDPDENIGIDKYAFWLTTSQPCVGWQSCMDAFDAVIEKWIEFWKPIGTPRQFLGG